MTALVPPARMRSAMAARGAGIDEAEARMILDSIRTRFPELGA